MEWDEDAKVLIKNVPEGILDFVVENAETFARETRLHKSIQQVTYRADGRAGDGH